MLRRPWHVFVLLLLWGCARAGGYEISVGHNNLSDSYVYPYRIAINGEAGIPGGGLKGCSEDGAVNALATVTVKGVPRFVVVEWEHLLSRKAYRARIDLDTRDEGWWRKPPFPDGEGYPVLIIQWRGARRVVAMLVADFTDYSKGRLELGEAEGEEIPRPEGGVRLYSTNRDYRRRPGDEYWPGTVYSYRRKSDEQLTPEQRYGCPRLPDGRVDTTKLPPEKLPFLIGENGEYIPCEQYSCDDKKELIARLRKFGRKHYPENITPPPIEFRDAPNPRPAW